MKIVEWKEHRAVVDGIQFLIEESLGCFEIKANNKYFSHFKTVEQCKAHVAWYCNLPSYSRCAV